MNRESYRIPRPITPSHAQRFAALKREILDLEYFCKGTVLQRMMKCGNPRCPCHRHPGQRHGPYWECTYKVQNKTVNLKLYPETVPIYRAVGWSPEVRQAVKALLTVR